MEIKRFLGPFILILVTILFFYKSFLLFQVPFPGDLLISEYTPWKYETYLGYNPGSYPNKAQYFDVIRQLYPWKILAIDQLKNGQIPLWNPYNFSGSPLLANNQSAVLNPFNVLFFILSPSIAWSAFIIIQPFLASLFMYWYLRYIKLPLEQSLFGGIAYGFSLFMSTFLEYGNIGHTIMWLPFVLFLAERVGTKSKPIFDFAFPIVIAIIIFSGHLQLAFGILAFLIFYIFFVVKNSKRIWTLFFLGICLSAIQLLPTFELIVFSARTPHDLDTLTQNFLLQLHQLVVFVSPDIYGNPATRNYLLTDTYPGNAVYVGAVVLLFALYALTKFKQNLYIKFYTLAAVVLLIFLTSNPISTAFFALKLPLLSTSSPANFFFLLSFTLSLLGAYGLTVWQKKKEKSIIIILAGLVLLIILLLGIHHGFKIPFYLKQALIGLGVLVVAGMMLLFAKRINYKILVYIFIFITSLELFYYFHKFNPFVPSSFLYPPTQIETFIKEKSGNDRFWGIGAANFEANFSTKMRLYSPEGYDPLYPKWYGEYISEGSTIFMSRSDARLLNPSEKGLVSTKYILDRVENGSSEKQLPIDSYKLVQGFDGWKIYENTKALPRVFTITSECKQPTPLSNCYENGYLSKGSILSYSPNQIRIKTGPRMGTLVLTDTYFPGWNAYHQGKRLVVGKYGSAFRSIENISAGQEIVFRYQPDSFKWGSLITIISVVLVLTTIKRSVYEK